MACPKCGKKVPKRYRADHAMYHFNKKKDVIPAETEHPRVLRIHNKNEFRVSSMWKHLKLSVKSKT